MASENKYEFKAEIKKLLRILSQSLYQHREIFLRELISNSSDALKKMHFISLQNKDVQDPDLELFIEIFIDSKERTLTISDTGLGMTKDELINNLGIIASSGTQKFLENLKTTEESKAKEIDLDIIGQFGVGFYSVFMVADRVKVVSKSHIKEEPAYEWESDGSGEFTVNPAQKDKRGTDIIVYLKEDDEDKMEFLTQYQIEEIIKKYSNFIPYPIYVTDKTDKDKKREVDLSEESKEEKKEELDKAKEEDKEEKKEETKEDKKEEKPKRKPVNELEPLWKRNANDIKKEDYEKFYHYISNRYDNYEHVINYKVDGQVQFRSIMFVPQAKTKDLFQADVEYGLALFSKNVMIIKQCKELIPLWLRFMKGIVESEDIPLNISRDTIQNNRTITKMRNLIVSRFIKELNDLVEKEPDKYKQFWKEFGVFIKEGIVTDRPKQEELLKLLRFQTSKTKDNEFIGLDEYIKRMPEGQTEIYYLIGENMNTLKISPHLGYYNNKGYEVIFLNETIDNFMMMNVMEYKQTVGEGDKKEEKHYKFTAIDVTEKKIHDDKGKDEKDKEDKDKQEEKKEEIPEDTKKFLDYVKSILKNKILDASVSDRLYNSACRLANPADGLSSSMQRAMRYWTQQTQTGKEFEIPKKILEFNPTHPAVKSLIELYNKDPNNGKIKPVVEQMFENCLFAEGDLPDPSLMVPRLNQLIEMLLTGRDDVKAVDEDIRKEQEEKEAKLHEHDHIEDDN